MDNGQWTVDREKRDRQVQDLLAKGNRSPFFEDLVDRVTGVCLSCGFERGQIVPTLEQLWLPIALKLATAQKTLNRTYIQGILGGQGTGKTTLCQILSAILETWGLKVASLSIDDLYLTYAARQTLQQQDPRLIWRGPPGTHDFDLGLAVINACLQNEATTEILLPRFDKSIHNGAGDRTTPQAIAKPDILLFEGWFVGVQPVAATSFDTPLEYLNTPEAIQFAQDTNQRLQNYLPLWEKLDSLIVLCPEDYRLSKQWRKQAEQQMIALGKTGMSDAEIDRFVEYFWQALHPELFITPLIQTADLVIKIKSDRVCELIINNS